MGKKLRQYLVQKLDDIQRLSSQKICAEQVSEMDGDSVLVQSPPLPVTPEIAVESATDTEDALEPQDVEFLGGATEPEDLLELEEPDNALSKVLDAFEQVRLSLQGLGKEECRFSASTDTPVAVDLVASQTRFPATMQDLEHFYHFFAKLKLEEGGDVFSMELQKREELYNATKATLENVSEVRPSLLHLMTLLSPKTYIVAFYAFVQGVQYPDLQTCTIFQSLPSFGMDVSDIFATHLHDIYLEGCKMLGLDPLQFSDDVSISELHLLVNIEGPFFN